MGARRWATRQRCTRSRPHGPQGSRRSAGLVHKSTGLLPTGTPIGSVFGATGVRGTPLRYPLDKHESDNGSEYINHQVAALLNKLHIGQFTKSRARQCNDNALVEGKNGAVIRHYLGYDHIPQRFAALVNAFTQEVLWPYLNYHRPCLFATERRDAKGRIRRHYRAQDAATPYEKLKSLPDPARFLKPGASFEALDALAHAQSDLDAARDVVAAREELFRTLGREWGRAA